MLRFKHLIPLAVAVVVLAGCRKKDNLDADGPTEPDDPTEYTITVKEPAVGTTMNGVLKIQMRIELSSADRAVRGLPGPIEIKENVTFSETILEQPKGAKKPTRSKIRFAAWEKGGTGPTVSDPGVVERVVGRDILFEKRGGTYQVFAEDGGPIDPNVRIFLEERYNELFEGFNAKDFLPTKPTRRNVNWDIPVKRLAKALGKANPTMPVDEKKSTGHGRLVSVSSKNGRKYGKIEITARLALTPSKEMGPVTIADGARIKVVTTIDTCIDGSVHDVKAEAKVTADIEMTGDGQTVRMKMDGKLTMSEAEDEASTAAAEKSATAKKLNAIAEEDPSSKPKPVQKVESRPKSSPRVKD